jgi:SAM-dependent methyltransferase
MKFFQYVKYFFYIAFNWNIRLALFTLYHEVRGEKKYRIHTTPIVNVKTLTVTGENISHALSYQGANYFLLENVFSWLQNIEGSKSIVDYGCGKGRVLVVAAFYDFNKIIGIDFAKELCEEAQKNISPLQAKFPEKTFKVIYVNAIDYVFDDDANVFFFFNPFDEIVMLSVVKNILFSFRKNPREIYVVYLNPVHKEIFMSAGFEEVYHVQKLYFVQAIIYKKSPEDFEAH